jgi:hypothetical protein
VQPHASAELLSGKQAGVASGDVVWVGADSGRDAHVRNARWRCFDDRHGQCFDVDVLWSVLVVEVTQTDAIDIE